jgi:hypothetical protein
LAVKDPMLKQRVRGEILEPYLADNTEALLLQSAGSYVHADSASRSGRRGVRCNAQEFLIALSEGKVTLDGVPALPSYRRRSTRRAVKAK